MVAIDSSGDSAIEDTLGGATGFAATLVGGSAATDAWGDADEATVDDIAGAAGADTRALVGTTDAVSEEQPVNNAMTGIKNKT